MKTCSWSLAVVLSVCACLASAHGLARAGEVYFLPRVEASRPLLTLGDMAEIVTADENQAASLSSIELFPAPAAGRSRLFRARELQDLLALRGVDLSTVRFGGASVIHVEGVPRRAAAEHAPAIVARADKTQLEPAVVEAVVSVPQSVVVAARAIPRGRVVQAADVRLELAQPGGRTVDTAVAIDDVVGKQATRALVAGSPISARSLRKPIIVRRGDVLRVTVQVSNVTVTTGARAMDDGSQGDLIEVQALDSRERYVAHVTGFRQVAVYPRRIQVTSAPVKEGGSSRNIGVAGVGARYERNPGVSFAPLSPTSATRFPKASHSSVKTQRNGVAPASLQQPDISLVTSDVAEIGWKPRRQTRPSE